MQSGDVLVLPKITMVMGSWKFQHGLCSSGNVLQKREEKGVTMSISNFVLSPNLQDTQLAISFENNDVTGS